MSDAPTNTRAGFCAILGLPNVGKSTLLNRILGVRLVAVSARPQTTRNRIVGVHAIDLPAPATDDDAPAATDAAPVAKAQIAYVDTPGLQIGKGALRRYMRDEALSASSDCDVALLVVDASDSRGRNPGRLVEPDAAPLAEAARRVPTVIALNKVDRVAKPDLLPLIASWSQWAAEVSATGREVEVVPIAGITGDGVERLERVIAKHLPVGPMLFPEDMVTDRAERFLASELIREQLYHQLGKELPYAAAVVIETYEERSKGDVAISAVIVVERESQKAIVVGKGGTRIKQIGIAAREAVSELLACPVHVHLHVKVEADWSNGDRGIVKLGYGGES